MPPIVNDQVAWSVGVSVGLSPSEPCENSEAIEIPFAFRTRVGPGKDLLHIADRFGRILYCVHSTAMYHYDMYVKVAYDNFDNKRRYDDDMMNTVQPSSSLSLHVLEAIFCKYATGALKSLRAHNL